jgi:NADPH-dependent curcumin reductase CurA
MRRLLRAFTYGFCELRGWRERFNAPAASLLKIAIPKPGDVVFVSAASGAVGSAVCQIAKLKGHTVVGSAGGAAKCAFVKQIGADRVIDYKATRDLTDALLHAAPTGIDVYFENVGGEHLFKGENFGKMLVKLG